MNHTLMWFTVHLMHAKYFLFIFIFFKDVVKKNVVLVMVRGMWQLTLINVSFYASLICQQSCRISDTVRKLSQTSVA